jgi:hypothetical protein
MLLKLSHVLHTHNMIEDIGSLSLKSGRPSHEIGGTKEKR